MNENRLDAALDELRELHVNSDLVSERAHAFFDNWAPVPDSTTSKPQWWQLSLGMGVAGAAAALFTWHLTAQTSPDAAANRQNMQPADNVPALEAAPSVEPTIVEPTIVEIGAYVALTSAPASAYTVESVIPEQTRLRVTRGAVTVRLFHDGREPHELAVSAGQHEFIARGTVYTVTPSPEGASVSVHEGTVWVRDGAGNVVAEIDRGEAWPDGSQLSETSAASRLLHHSLSEPPARRPPSRSAVRKQRRAPSEQASPETTSEQWQRARLLRAQGKTRAALAALRELAASPDATWAPLAIIEQIRIQRDISVDAPAIISLGREFHRRFPGHALTDEVMSMVCPVLRRKGDTDSLPLCISEPTVP